MELDYTWWKGKKYFVGYLNDYPEDPTQGETLEELEDALKEVYEIRQDEARTIAETIHTGKLRIAA